MSACVPAAALPHAFVPVLRMKSYAHAPEFRGYESAAELRRLVQESEACDPEHPTTVVVVLDERFRGHLPTLIRREAMGFRLVIVPLAKRLPGTVTVGDLSAACGALGWQQIVVERELSAALQGSRASLAPGERLLVLWPAWKDLATERGKL